METQDSIFVFFAVIFILAIVRQILYWSWLWQLKEYRTDRMRAHFQDIGNKSAFLALIGFSAIRQNKIPKLTAKSILIIFFSVLSSVAILFLIFWNFPPVSQVFDYSDFISYQNFLFNNDFLFSCLIVEYLMMPTIIFCFVIILNGLSAIFKKRIVAKAKTKIAGFSNLKVIGITGSYGKTITKEILADILSKKYKVLKTPANINTAIGIAQLILDKLDETCEIFVAEMGAYKIGEIKEICEMVKPSIGIITAINEQHLALFGDIENTIKAKFELVDSLHEKGLAILNIGDENIQSGMELRNSFSHWLKARVKLYSVGTKSNAYAISEATDRQVVKFKFISGINMKDFIVNIAGAHNISNILAAIIAAEDLGMELDEISQILQKADYSNAALKNLAGLNGSTLIDDTYNANPDGVLAALRFIKNKRGRKIIVMSSLIELGSSAHKTHERLGEEISRIAAKLFFLDNYYFSDIKKGAEKNKESETEIRNEKNAKKISEYLKNELKPSDIVMFINRGSRKVLEELKK